MLNADRALVRLNIQGKILVVLNREAELKGNVNDS